MSTVKKAEITRELEESYIDYAMSVIVSRALPDVRDGLKPVHRRILWDMWDSGLVHSAKFRKSANVIGQVLARYHPHGDVAVYDALVRMAQDFSLRYPLIEGQGNFGSIDGDSAAAYRYTEARLSKIAEEMLKDIEKDTVDWQPNYDATRNEPKVLPSKLPNLILNGGMGIAVGMATNIPPHNLNEVSDAILHLIDNPRATNEDIMRFIKGPDFPTGGLIFNKKLIDQAYINGKGPIIVRARTDIVEKKSGQFNILIKEIPYQVNKAELIKKIAELVQGKKIEGIRDIRDESDREGMRVLIELKPNVQPKKILNQLYKHTDLQKDFHMNMIALVNGIEPQVLSIKEILSEYINHRRSVVRRRTEFDLRKAKERAHILEGLSKALANIDDVIKTIKKSRDRESARVNLMKKFKLTEIQANAILEMKLQTLAALERQKIEDELKEKKLLIKELEVILKSQQKLLKIIKDEVIELKDKYGDERRTELIEGDIKEFKEEDLIPNDDVVITLSKEGYIKRLPSDTFTVQHRGGKGLIGSDVREGDFLEHFVSAKSHDNILFFTDRGRVFQTKVYEIPQANRTSKGRAIYNFLEISTDENISAIVTYPSAALSGKNNYCLVMATKNGLIKRVPVEDFKNIRRTGIIALKLKKGDSLKWVSLSADNDDVVITTERGQSIRFTVSKIRKMGRSASGIKAINLKDDDKVAGFDVIRYNIIKSKANARLLVVMENGFAKQTPVKEYKVQNRGGSGIKTANITEKTGRLICAKVVTEEKEIIALSVKGQVIRTKLDSVRTAGRSTQGVKIMKLKQGDRLVGVVVI